MKHVPCQVFVCQSNPGTGGFAGATCNIMFSALTPGPWVLA